MTTLTKSAALADADDNRKIYRGDIYMIDFDGIIGCEQGGIRPALVIQNDKGNAHSPTVIIAAITTSNKKTELPTHIALLGVSGLKENSMLLMEQIRTVDKARLRRYMGSLGTVAMRLVDAALAASVGLRNRREPLRAITLCGSCRGQYEGAGFALSRLSGLRGPKSTCDYCNTRTGFEYEIEEG
jgi:mRNA interferase MazF